MRVHPTNMYSAGAKWHFPVAVALLVGVLISNLFRGPDQDAAASQASMERVIISEKHIEAGEVLTKDHVQWAERPRSTLPADVMLNPDDVLGKQARGPIPAGYPLSASLLMEKSEEEAVVEPVKVDPLEQKLSEIRSTTVALSINFPDVPPEAGQRIALSLIGKNGESALVAEEAWVEHAEKKTAQIRVFPHEAIYLEQAKPLGQFSYFVIPEEGDSPFKGQAVRDILALRERFGFNQDEKVRRESRDLAKQRVAKQEQQNLTPSSFRSYAWITGQGQKYSVDEKGKIYVIDSTGLVTPLYDFEYNLKPQAFPFLFGSSDESPSPQQQPQQPETEQRPPREVHTGLEPFYPPAETK